MVAARRAYFPCSGEEATSKARQVPILRPSGAAAHAVPGLLIGDDPDLSPAKLESFLCHIVTQSNSHIPLCEKGRNDDDDPFWLVAVHAFTTRLY